MAPIQCAILGMGMSTTVFHAPFILALPDQFQLRTILERKSTPSFSLARDRYPGVIVENTLEAILEDPVVQLVFVSTINNLHYAHTKVCPPFPPSPPLGKGHRTRSRGFSPKYPFPNSVGIIAANAIRRVSWRVNMSYARNLSLPLYRKRRNFANSPNLKN